MSLEKGLKIKNSTEGKVLTTDGNGVAVSSDVDVNDIASATELSNVSDRVGTAEGNLTNLENRVSNLEDDVETIANKIVNINGEEVE